MAEPEKTTDKNAPARFRWITNNEERVRIMNCRGTMSEVSKTTSPGPVFALPPGASVVDEKLWKRWLEENADVQVEGETVKGHATLLLKEVIPTDPHRSRRSEGAGQPYLVEGPLTKSRETPLASLDEAKAAALVPSIHDEAQLRRMLIIERRSTVVEAIRKSLEGYAKATASPVL